MLALPFFSAKKSWRLFFFFPFLIFFAHLHYSRCYEKQARIVWQSQRQGNYGSANCYLRCHRCDVFQKLFTTWLNGRKRKWLHGGPKPPITNLYPNILNRAESQNICAPYKKNSAAKYVLHSASYCETIVIMLSSSVTFLKREQLKFTICSNFIWTEEL